MSSNLPDGVTDAHPHFNPKERPTTVSCTSDEALVLPSLTIKTVLAELAGLLEEKQWTLPRHRAAVEKVKALQLQIEDIEREGGYECQWVGELDLPVSEEAMWECPRCGAEQSTDTIPEDRDPDEEWDDRYDD